MHGGYRYRGDSDRHSEQYERRIQYCAYAHLARLGATINELNHKVQLLKYDLEEAKEQLRYTKLELKGTARKLMDARMSQTAVSENVEVASKEAE